MRSAAGLNVSNLTQDALRSALAVRRLDAWLDEATQARPVRVSRQAVAAAVTAAKGEIEGDA